uniref:Beta-1,4-N-acetylgalactosaminyltransferase n=1 Tax=Cyclopterus lumpus TaxID=8103 RepID=A0A8C3B3F1_CYCLU
MLRFPVKKIRKQFKLLLLLVLLTSAVWFTYLHINQGKTIKLHFNYGKGRLFLSEPIRPGHHKSEDTSDSREDEAAVSLLSSALTCVSLTLCRQFKGQANLHVFEDWCGSSTAQLRKNLHFPHYPHTRTTLRKLAVAPKWKNYGLRIFGFLHPYRDGDFQFSVSSDDNSEFWLSSDESPLNARLLVYVGQLGTEWTAPGEFSKFRSQSSKSVHLISSRRYYFEILHKQDDKGSDHVEVGWRPFLPGLKYEVIDSAYISLYTDESNLKMNSVDHIPQTLASHIRLPEEGRGRSIPQHGADMLKPDPRDTFYSTPMIDPSRLENVLPACLYSPTYVVKDFPIARYQGLQFVYLSFVYPNDFTRLTHMERENKCFYRESPIYLEKFGFYKYMKMDEEEDDRPFFFPNPDGKLIITNIYIHTRTVDTLSFIVVLMSPDFLDEEEVVDVEDEVEIVGTQSPKKPSHPSQTSHTSDPSHPHSKSAPTPIYITRPRPAKERERDREREREQRRERREERASRHPREVFPGVFLYQTRKTTRLVNLGAKGGGITRSRSLVSAAQLWPNPPTKEGKTFPHNGSISIQGESVQTSDKLGRETSRSNPDNDPEPEPEEGEMSDYSYEEVEARPGWAEESINWQRTFSVNPMDFELLRSDWNDLRCNVSGNLQLAESEVVDVLAQYMEKLNERNGGIYTLLRIVNVEKRRDSARGNRYLVELELMERGRSVVRLSEYIYLLLHRSRQGEESLENTDFAPASAPPLLCQPVMLQWRKDVMVHFVVPVKNQARWVQQFISDMENLHLQTKDDNFNIIIVDFESEDMDVEQALRESTVPRYEYLRREGNFERSAGLQIGVDTIEDSHSIVFLCDLHIHFPLNILESIRKHCVEGRLAFAPIVMRLSCGSSPQAPDGYWEVNGFGLFGIYKSDFDKIGGMNTEEFKDRWGGEDWELLDRVLQNGLEVERLRLRNFFHYYHSKRGMWNTQNKKTLKG